MQQELLFSEYNALFNQAPPDPPKDEDADGFGGAK